VTKQTPFRQFHADHGAKFVDFAGWEMPIMYTSIIEEHRQVRTSAGLFDVSHMARIVVKGRDSRRFLERMCTRRIHDMQVRQCRYSLICNEQGGVKDDVLVYRHDEDEFMLVVNAANRRKILDHFTGHRGDLDFDVNDRTEKTGMVAIQGPRAIEVIGNFSSEVPTLKNYRFTEKKLLLARLIISRTGYTGEDGVEIIMPASLASMAVKMLLEQEGLGEVVKPAGLGARDTLRLEAGMPLYGHEMDEETDPVSAGLMFGMNLDKDEHGLGEAFIGQAALRRIHESGPRQRLVGLAMEGRRTPRQGMAIMRGDETIGRVTSGCQSPTLGHPIAMGYVPAESAEPGTAVEIDLGRSRLEAVVAELPFYKRPR